MKMTSLILAASGLLLCAGAQADVAVTADLGTTGIGAHLVVPMEKDLNGRFGINYFSHTTSKMVDTVNFNMKLTLNTYDILFDYYPTSSPLRVTAGVLYNGNKVEGQGTPNATGGYLINGVAFTVNDVGNLKGIVEYRKASPYLGVGFGNALTPNKRWNFSGDLGAILQGRANTQLAATGCTTSNGVCGVLATAVAAEKTAFTNSVNRYSVYPVLRVAVGYNF